MSLRSYDRPADFFLFVVGVTAVDVAKRHAPNVRDDGSIASVWRCSIHFRFSPKSRN
jgi:hypothetical protein